jgi:hypothetical protein
MTSSSQSSEAPRCNCPLYCKYCGAKLRRDPVGHYCPTRNCQWQHGANNCQAGLKGKRYD